MESRESEFPPTSYGKSGIGIPSYKLWEVGNRNSLLQAMGSRESEFPPTSYGKSGIGIPSYKKTKEPYRASKSVSAAASPLRIQSGMPTPW